MKKQFLLLFIALTFYTQAQFVEVGTVYNSGTTIVAAVMGKDANGMLYGTGVGGVYRKTDQIDSDWQNVSLYSGRLAICELSGYIMYVHNYNEVLSSTNGQNWVAANLPEGAANVIFIQYLDNNHLIIAKDNRTYISTNGGANFQDFLNTPILSIAWDISNNRYVYSTSTGLYAKSSISASSTLIYSGSVHETSSTGQYGYFMCIDKNGIVYTTEHAPFPYIKIVDPNIGTLTNYYPAGTSYPIHARGLFATKTGRVYCLSWNSASALLITDDPANNYISTIPQGGFDSYFMDKAGFLYLNRGGSYTKSLYSVRQPVFFKQMDGFMESSFLGKGFNLRASDNSLLSFDYPGNIYSSLDNGETWDSILHIPNFNSSFPIGKIFQHPNGKIYVGRGGPDVLESNDDGQTWQTSTLATTYNNGSFTDAAYKANGNYTFYIKEDLMLRSQNDGDTLETMASLYINTPGFGITKGYRCIEVTDLGTVLIGGRINTGNVYRSTDNLDSITVIPPLGNVQQEIYDIYQDATGKIWMGTYLGLLFSTDDGLTWAQDPNYPELSALEIIENGDGKVIVAGNYATYMLENSKWSRISYGYNRNFKNLFLDPVTSRLFSQGNYKTASTSPENYTPIFSRKENSIHDIELNFYPNPSSDFIHVKNEQSEAGVLIIFSSLGQKMLYQKFTADQNVVNLSIADYTPGVYFLVKKTDGNAISKQVVVE